MIKSDKEEQIIKKIIIKKIEGGLKWQLQAKLRHQRLSPQKARLIADIKDKNTYMH